MDRYGRSWYDGVCIGRALGDPRMSAPHAGHGLIGVLLDSNWYLAVAQLWLRDHFVWIVATVVVVVVVAIVASSLVKHRPHRSRRPGKRKANLGDRVAPLLGYSEKHPAPPGMVKIPRHPDQPGAVVEISYPRHYGASDSKVALIGTQVHRVLGGEWVEDHRHVSHKLRYVRAGTVFDEPPVIAPVATVKRTDWRERVVIGHDERRRPMTFATSQTHSMFVGGTGSGKTWAGRLVVAHAVLDPAVKVYCISGKDDAGDWRPMRPICERYTAGASIKILPAVESLLREVEALSESRQDAGHDVPGVVVVVDEWYRVRLAANREDKQLAKRLDSLMGELLATSRSRNVHFILCVQRGTVEYLPGDQKANILQRLVGRTASDAEVRYVLDEVPEHLPTRPGQFLVSADERSATLARIDSLDNAAWSQVCDRAAQLRGRADVQVSNLDTHARVKRPDAHVQLDETAGQDVATNVQPVQPNVQPHVQLDPVKLTCRCGHVWETTSAKQSRCAACGTWKRVGVNARLAS
jgi:hypothetical protein